MPANKNHPSYMLYLEEASTTSSSRYPELRSSNTLFLRSPGNEIGFPTNPADDLPRNYHGMVFHSCRCSWLIPTFRMRFYQVLRCHPVDSRGRSLTLTAAWPFIADRPVRFIVSRSWYTISSIHFLILDVQLYGRRRLGPSPEL